MAAYDDRLQKALEHAHYRSTLETQRRNLRLTLDVDLIHAENGGVFAASESLIAFVQTLLAQGWTDAVLRDSRDIPVRVADLAAFRDALLERWTGAMNAYHAGHERLRRARTVGALTGAA